MSTYRTIFTAEEAQDHFGDYLAALNATTISKEFEGYKGKVYYGVEVKAAIEMIREWVKDECGI